MLLLSACSAAAPVTTTTEEKLPAVTSDLQLYCFQAGKADAFLFWNDAGAVLIDTGESGFGKVILEKMEELGISRIDVLILTHFDKDHVGGAKKLLNSIEIGTIYQSNCPKTGADAYEKYVAALAESGKTAQTVRERVSFLLGDTVFTINPPAEETYSVSPSNNSSLIVRVMHGTVRMLFCGDAGDARMTEYLRTDATSYQLVKLPHHGAWQTSLNTLIAQTKPEYALITSSDEETEDVQTRELLEKAGVKILLTRLGPVQISSDGERLLIQS